MAEDKSEGDKKSAQEKLANEEAEMAKRKVWELINSQQQMKGVPKMTEQEAEVAHNRILELITNKSTTPHLSAQEEERPVYKSRNVFSEDIDEITKMYNEKFRKMPDGTDNSCYKEPVRNSDGSCTMTFNTETEANDFSAEIAEKGINFTIVKDNIVIGYSNGDGKLYHGNGDEFQKGDGELKSSGISRDKFTMPDHSSPRP